MAYQTGSAADQISRLKLGEAFSRSTFMPGEEVTPEKITDERRGLVQILSPVVARVRDKHGGVFSMHTTTAFTRGYDVIVTVVVLKEGEDDEI